MTTIELLNLVRNKPFIWSDSTANDDEFIGIITEDSYNSFTVAWFIDTEYISYLTYDKDKPWIGGVLIDYFDDKINNNQFCSCLLHELMTNGCCCGSIKRYGT